MNEFRFEVKYMLKMYYNLRMMKELKMLLTSEIKKRSGIDSEECKLAELDLKETSESLKILKGMVGSYYNIKEEEEIDKKISAFVQRDPYFKLTTKMAKDYYSKVFNKALGNEIN
jgi:hypothetical protein